jgi:branched-chain amino acid transport system permease protein
VRASLWKISAWVIIGLLLLFGPWFLGTFYLYTLNLILVNIIVAAGLNLLIGNAGQVSLCNSSFMAIGAYSVMILNLQIGLTYWLALPIGGFVAAVFGFALGFPALRLRGYYLALATLGFLEIIQIVIQEFPGLTGGVRGMVAPRPTLAGLKLTNDLSFYYPILLITLAMLYVIRNLSHSPVGRAFAAIRNSEPAAQALGISLSRAKVLAFTVCAFYAGLAGGLYAPLVGFIDPVEFGLGTSIFHLTIIIVGGLGSIVGSIVGAVVITGLPEWLRGLKEYRDLAFGGLLLCSLIFMPRGIVGIWPYIRRLGHSTIQNTQKINDNVR